MCPHKLPIRFHQAFSNKVATGKGLELYGLADDMSPQLNEREASDKSLQGAEMVGGFGERGLVGGQVGATATKEREDGGQGGVIIGGGRREAIV